MIRERFPHVSLIQNDKNSGFARANNQGILQSTGRYVLLLNSDTIIMPGALEKLFEFMEKHPEVGAAAACLLNSDGSLQYSCSPAPTLLGEVQRMLHFPGLRSDGYYSMEGWDQNQPHEVEVILGACMFLRREMLDQVGLLDEDFFMYSEEVDLCYRMRKAGWRIFWIPQSQVIHHGGQSTRQVSAEMFLHLYKSKLIYFRKTYGWQSAMVYKVLLMVSSLIRLLLVSLVWLEGPQERRIHLVKAGNYQRLLLNLPMM
jgi:hypothetical protein